jgi:dTMP kinase
MVFITVEGLDGAGGTTLVEAIGEEYPNAVMTSEPSDLEYGQLVRRNLSDEDSDPIVDFYLFMSDRRHHIEERVKPADQSGKLVVSDRYADSTRAYQPVALSGDGDEPFDSGWEAKMFIEQTMAFWNYEPDITLYIDISVETAIERADGDEKYEKRQFLQKVKENYDALADTTDRIIRIDGEQSKEDVKTAALGKLDVVARDRL